MQVLIEEAQRSSILKLERNSPVERNIVTIVLLDRAEDLVEMYDFYRQA